MNAGQEPVGGWGGPPGPPSKEVFISLQVGVASNHPETSPILPVSYTAPYLQETGSKIPGWKTDTAITADPAHTLIFPMHHVYE